MMIVAAVIIDRENRLETSVTSTITLMVADILNSPTGAIYFGLQIMSCDCHITKNYL